MHIKTKCPFSGTMVQNNITVVQYRSFLLASVLNYTVPYFFINNLVLLFSFLVVSLLHTGLLGQDGIQPTGEVAALTFLQHST